MIGYTCPVCGSPIEWLNATLITSYCVPDPYVVKLENTIRHVQPFTEGCQELFRLFVEEQKDILKKVMDRFVEQASQNLHRL